MLSLVLISLSAFGESATALATGRAGWIHEIPSFEDFNVRHGRHYSPDSPEYKLRHSLFEMRVAEVRQHNSRPHRNWQAAVNHLTDRTEEELAALRGWRGHALSGTKRSVGNVGRHRSRSKAFLRQAGDVVIPASKSWGHLNAIQEEVDQGGCGSCWAMATITLMNAADEIAGMNRSFSAQDVVDCTPNPHNCGGQGGCDGATVELAMNYIETNGLRSNLESPYAGFDKACADGSSLVGKRQSATLQADGDVDIKSQPTNRIDHDLEQMIHVGQHNVAAGTAGAQLGLQYWNRLPENEFHPMFVHLVQYGPLAISVAASGWSAYSNGVFDSCDTNFVIDHAVVLFGYGHDDDTNLDFWDIKNSWGSFWGRSGNIRMKREASAADVACGMDKQPEVGTGCEGGPAEVRVCGMCGIYYDAVSVKMR